MNRKVTYLVVGLAVFALAAPAIAADPGKGYILVEEWTDTDGAVTNDVDTLKAYAEFPDNPSDSYWTESFTRPDGGEDNWGGRFRGYIYPPQTGDYTFWTCSDDDSELYLSTDEDPANAVMIANVEGWMPYQAWDGAGGAPDTNFESDPIPLQAGQRYYIEALFSDGTGGGHLSVGWAGPGIGAGPVLIDGDYLAAVLRDPEPMFLAKNPTPADGTTGVTSLLLQWDPGLTALWHDVYFGTDPEPPLIGRQMFNLYYVITGLEPGATYYWKVDQVEADGTTIHEGQRWTFTAAPVTAWSPEPGNGARFVAIDVTLAWQPGQGATSHDAYLGTDADAVANRDAGVLVVDGQPLPSYEATELQPGTTYYWLVDEYDMSGTKYEGEVWSFATRPVIEKTPNLVGWWKLDDERAGMAIDYSGWNHDGTPEGDPQWVEGFQGDALAFDGAGDYVDCGNPPEFTIQDELTLACWIKVAAFTVPWETIIAKGDNSYRMSRGPEDGDSIHFACTGTSGDHLNGSTIVTDDSWHHVACVYDGVNRILYLDGFEDARVSSTGQISASTYNLFIGENSQQRSRNLTGLVDDVRLYNRALTEDEVKQMMRGDVTLAWDPQPRRSVNVDIRNATSLAWQAGDGAVQHDVYFGTDKDAVKLADTSDPEYLGRQSATSYPLAGLIEFGGGTYSWRIDEVEADGTTMHFGSVWSFTIPDFLIVDDFEIYTNDAEKMERVFQTWIDGWGYNEPPPGNPGNGTGATGGHDIWSPDSPYYQGQIMEVDNPHGGLQAMPVYFDNSQSPYKSEVDRTWAVAQDFTAAGATDLSLWFHGSAAGFIDNGGGSFTMSASGTDIWGTVDEFRFACKTLNGNGSITAKVESIGNTNEWAKAGVMIREGLSASAKHVMVVVTPAQGIQFTWRDFSNADMTEHNTQTGLTAPYWVRLTRTGNTFTAELSADGATWAPVVDAASNTHELTMMGNIHIGLALTSHNENAVTVAEFSNVSTSGGTSGAWQIEEVGIDHPENDLADTYVRLQDSMGRSFAVSYPSGSVVNDWTQWRIPLTEFVGVSTNSIKKMTLGIGNPDAPVADGAGVVYYDDIHVTLPPPVEDPNEAATE